MNKCVSKNIRALFPSLKATRDTENVYINDLTFNSQKVIKGGAFLAINCAAEAYIDHAIKAGAVLIVRSNNTIPGQKDDTCEWNENRSVVTVYVDGLEEKAGTIAARFFGFPEKSLCLIGITGTNGKTSCAEFFRQAWMSMGYSSATIGTLGWRINQASYVDTGMTMLDACENQRILAHFVTRGVTHVAMEVSSHGIAQQRHQGLKFAARVLTNISRDHLDYHGDMTEYAAIKMRFVTTDTSKVVVNLDGFEKNQKAQLGAILNQQNTAFYSMNEGDQNATVSVNTVRYSRDGIDVELTTTHGTIRYQNTLIGAFNVSNSLAVATVFLALEYEPRDIESALNELSSVEGRMQRVSCRQKNVFIDYAHTPDALKNALEAARLHCDGKLIVVFGCGGDRDSGKRQLMGNIAETYSDVIVLTSDNPRTESPDNIIEDIRKGMSVNDAIYEQPDRKLAIEMALNISSARDLLLIAGKGHERYQEINGKKIPFYDGDVVEGFDREAS